jgi:hypothetical protein
MRVIRPGTVGGCGEDIPSDNRRLHSAIGDIPAEYEVLYYQQREAAEAA